MLNDSLSGIVAFVETVEAGNFAAAAERMRLTRSAVGKSIARLEQRLGVRLFQRTTRTQSLTEDGQAYYERCVRALAELDAGASALDHGRREPVGLLKVTMPVVFGRLCVAPILTAWARAHTRLKLELTFNDRFVDVIEEGFDLAVRIGQLEDSATLVARRVATQRMVVCASPDYVARHGGPIDIGSLSQHPAIAYGRAGRIKPWIMRDRDGRTIQAQLTPAWVLDDIQAIADAAAAGDGLAWLPCWLMRQYQARGQLQEVMPCEQMLTTDIHVLWPSSRYLPSRVRGAIDQLVAEMPALVAGREATAS